MSTEPASLPAVDLETGEVPVYLYPTEITVSCMPADDTYYASSFDIKVQYRGDGLYGVYTRGDIAIGRDGQVSYEERPSERTEEWIGRHRFDLETALAVAKVVARQVQIGPKDNPLDVAQALRRRAEALERQAAERDSGTRPAS